MQRRNNANCDDRLSSLPDSVLCHILSFLPTKFSVATSVLAKRYRCLWADVHNLDFVIDTCCFKINVYSLPYTVNRVMLLRNVRNINTFRLVIGIEDFDDYLLDTWIRSAAARKVQALDITLFRDYLPNCLFHCGTLVDLSLHECFCAPDDDIFLPNLKKLHLHENQYGNDQSLQNLISGCPVIEELIVDIIINGDLKCCIISSPTLKRLTLKFHYYEVFDYGHGVEEDFGDYKVEINTPALRYLNLDDTLSQHTSFGNFNSLVGATICVDNDEVKDNVLYSSSVLEWVEKLCQVKFLKLSSSYSQFRGSLFAASTSKFINLTKLELAADWIFLLKFLESADCLQVLIIKEVGNNLKHWKEPRRVPVCVSSRLKQVTIDSFGYSGGEYRMVNYFLRNGKFLDMMDITSRKWKGVESSLQMKFNALQKISEFVRDNLQHVRLSSFEMVLELRRILHWFEF